jgi:hypothetical protein
LGEIKSIDGIENTHIVDRGEGKLEGKRRHALSELLLLCLGVELILMLPARVLSDELVHDVRVSRVNEEKERVKLVRSGTSS